MAAKKNSKKSEFLLYKGKPLVRQSDVIYYGDMSDKYVIMMQVKEKKEQNGVEMATKVSVHLQMTDNSGRPPVKTVKSSEKNGLYDAIDIGQIWLERALSE